MIEKRLRIINKLGLHARAAMQLINTACRFQSDIQIEYQGNQTDAKDILCVMSLAAKQGSDIKLIIDGEDAEEAMQALTTLIENRFGEDE